MVLKTHWGYSSSPGAPYSPKCRPQSIGILNNIGLGPQFDGSFGPYKELWDSVALRSSSLGPPAPSQHRASKFAGERLLPGRAIRPGTALSKTLLKSPWISTLYTWALQRLLHPYFRAYVCAT